MSQGFTGSTELNALIPVVAIYTSTSAQSISASTTTIYDFENVVLDTDSAVTTGVAWVFTCPRAGRYHVTTDIFWDAATMTVGRSKPITIFVEGAAVHAGTNDPIFVTVSENISVHVSTIVDLALDDEVNIRLRHTETTSRSTSAAATLNRVAIAEIL